MFKWFVYKNYPRISPPLSASLDTKQEAIEWLQKHLEMDEPPPLRRNHAVGSYEYYQGGSRYNIEFEYTETSEVPTKAELDAVLDFVMEEYAEVWRELAKL